MAEITIDFSAPKRWLDTAIRNLKLIGSERININMRNPVNRMRRSIGSYATRNRGRRTSELATFQSFTFAALHDNASVGMTSKIIVKTLDDKDEFVTSPNHPIEKIFNRPNPEWSRESFLYSILMSMQLDRAYVFVWPNTRGEMAEFWPIPFFLVEPVIVGSADAGKYFPGHNKDLSIAGYLYYPEGGNTTPYAIPPKYVIDIKYPNLFTTGESHAPYIPTIPAMRTDNLEAQWNRDSFDDGLPQSIVGVSQNLSDPELETVKEAIANHEDKTFVVRSGEVSIEWFKQSKEAMQFVESRSFNREEIREVITGVRGPIESKDSQKRNIDSRVWPMLCMIAGGFNVKLSPLFGDKASVEMVDIRPQDKSISIQESVQYSKFRSVNEERKQRLEPPMKKVIIPPDVLSFGGCSLYDDVPNYLVPVVLQAMASNTNSMDINFIPKQQSNGMPSLVDSAGPQHNAALEDHSANPDSRESRQLTVIDAPEVETNAGGVF